MAPHDDRSSTQQQEQERNEATVEQSSPAAPLATVAVATATATNAATLSSSLSPPDASTAAPPPQEPAPRDATSRTPAPLSPTAQQQQQQQHEAAEERAAEMSSHDAPRERTAPVGISNAEPNSSSSSNATTHHATNLLHEAVAREDIARRQRLRAQQQRQEQAQTQAQTRETAVPSYGDDANDADADADYYADADAADPQPIPTVSNASPEAVQSDAALYGEDVRTKNIPDLYYLFTNDKLKEEPLTQVLHSDPFCIPRLTDNVPEYRPAFNPLSILEGEEKLLPRYFRLDPFEGIPGASGKSTGAGSVSGKSTSGASASGSDKAVRDRAAMPLRASKAPGGGASSKFVGKTSTFMGTLPRQSEFSEIPVADTIFQTQQTFRPTPPPPPAPHPSYASKNLSILHAAKDWSDATAATAAVTQQLAGAPTGVMAAAGVTSNGVSGGVSSSALASVASTLSSADPVTPTALTDAMFLTSLHQSGTEQQQQQQTSAYARSDFQMPSYYTDTSSQQQSFYQQQQAAEPTAAGNKLTRYLSTRTSPSAAHQYLSDGAYLSDQQQQRVGSGVATGGDATQYYGAVFSEYRDSEHAMLGSTYDASSAALLQATQQQHLSGDDNMSSLQPIAKKPRSKNVFRPCTAPGCTKGARGKSGLCQKHGGGKRCAMPNCAKGAQGSSTMCLFHGGGYRCTVEGCTTGARGTSGLCAKHGGYKRSASKDAGGSSGGASSPNSGKRARTQHSPMDFDSDGGAAASAAPATPRFESMLFS